MARACSAGGGILMLGSAAEAEVEKSCEGRQPQFGRLLGQSWKKSQEARKPGPAPIAEEA